MKEVTGSSPVSPTKVIMLINLWHTALDMKKYDLAWHENDIQDELAELSEERGLINRWSEYSDVAYTYTRANWSGFKLELPITRPMFIVALVYMFPKYTLRWWFFKRAGKKFGKTIHEVRNPKKIAKLHIIAERNNIEPKKFEQVCTRQLRYWPLLK